MAKFSKTLTKEEIFQGYLYLDADFTFHFSEVLFSPIELPSEIMVTFDNSRSYEACKYNQTSKRLFGFTEWFLERKIQAYDTIDIEVDDQKICVSYSSPNEPHFDERFFPALVPEEHGDGVSYEESVVFDSFSRSKIGHGTEDYIKGELIELYLNHYKKLFITAVSRHYPLSDFLLSRYQEEWNWDLISMNQNIPLSKDILFKFRNRWTWWRLSERTNLPWSEEIIEEFDYDWNWQSLSENKSIPWTEYLLEKYQDKILWSLDEVGYQQMKDEEYSDWFDAQLEQAIYVADVEDKEVEFSLTRPPNDDYPTRTICSNPNIDWNVNLINQFIEHIDLAELCTNPSIDWSDEILDEFKDQLDWETLCSLIGVEWTAKRIQKYLDFIDWKALSGNRYIKWDETLIQKYEQKLDWTALSLNPALDISSKFIADNERKLDWSNLSANAGFINSFGSRDWHRSDTFANEFESLIDWRSFSANSGIYWYLGTLEKYVEKFDWDELSRNPAVGQTLFQIEGFEDRVKWDRMSENIGINFTNELVIKYSDKWNWRNLLENPEFSMTTEIEKECKDHLFGLSEKKLYKLAEHSHSGFVSKLNNSLRNDDTFHKDFSMLEHLPWTLQFLKQKVDLTPGWAYDIDTRSYHRLQMIGVSENRSIWERVFSPYVDDELIMDVMNHRGAVPNAQKDNTDEDEPLPF
jgi:hypothetical protein